MGSYWSALTGKTNETKVMFQFGEGTTTKLISLEVHPTFRKDIFLAMLKEAFEAGNSQIKFTSVSMNIDKYEEDRVRSRYIMQNVSEVMQTIMNPIYIDNLVLNVTFGGPSTAASALSFALSLKGILYVCRARVGSISWIDATGTQQKEHKIVEDNIGMSNQAVLQGAPGAQNPVQ